MPRLRAESRLYPTSKNAVRELSAASIEGEGGVQVDRVGTPPRPAKPRRIGAVLRGEAGREPTGPMAGPLLDQSASGPDQAHGPAPPPPPFSLFAAPVCPVDSSDSIQLPIAGEPDRAEQGPAGQAWSARNQYCRYSCLIL